MKQSFKKYFWLQKAKSDMQHWIQCILSTYVQKALCEDKREESYSLMSIIGMTNQCLSNLEK